MKITYNSPVILTYAVISIAALMFFPGSVILAFFSSPAHFSFKDPFFYFRLVSYIAGHGSWAHLTGNMTIILLVGPLLEEKYGSGKLLEMILATAVATAIINALLFPESLVGGSGVAFMLILLASFSNIKAGEIPLTFILIAVIYFGGELITALRADNVSQFGHITGGLIGAGYGFVRGGGK